jgi:flagellar hook-basal body complex protein FliE
MAIGGIRSLGSIDPRQAYAGQQRPAQGGGFGETLQNAIREVDHLQTRRDEKVEAMVRGERIEVHEIMTAAEEAQLAFDLMIQVRNKLLESYQEVMRMQV